MLLSSLSKSLFLQYVLVDKHRNYVHDGPLKLTEGEDKEGPKQKPYHCFLFSDLFLLTSVSPKEEGKYSLARYFRLAGCSVIDLKVEPEYFNDRMMSYISLLFFNHLSF